MGRAMCPISAWQIRAAEFDQRIKHRLQIERGAADELEHIGGGSLLLERFAQLVEQTCIFDGDRGLIGKGPPLACELSVGCPSGSDRGS